MKSNFNSEKKMKVMMGHMIIKSKEMSYEEMLESLKTNETFKELFNQISKDLICTKDYKAEIKEEESKQITFFS
jgi:hypothetical protein